MKSSFKMAGLLVSIALITGCAAEVQVADEDNGEPVLAGEQPLVEGGIRMRAGACHSDGMVIKGGVVYRLGVAVASDVTGISNRVRSPNGTVCHNTAVWREAANYVCNMNDGGTRNQSVDPFGEWIDGVLVTHPGGENTDGLYMAYVDMTGPCDTPSQLDYALDQIECCKATPTPW